MMESNAEEDDSTVSVPVFPIYSEERSSQTPCSLSIRASWFQPH